MNNKKTLFMSLVIVLLVGLMITAGTFAYFDTKIQIQNTTGSLVVPSFKLKARVKPNSDANAGTLKKADLAHIHYTVVEIDRIGQEIKADKADNTGARRCYEPSHIQKDGVGRDGLFVDTSNDTTIATGTFENMSQVLDGDGWTSAINLPSDGSKFLARQYNDDPVDGDLGTFGITFMGDIADSTGMRLTNRYFRVYVWIDAGYQYTNAGENMKDPMNNAIIEVTWSEDSIVQQVTGSVNRAPGLYELNGDYSTWNMMDKNDEDFYLDCGSRNYCDLIRFDENVTGDLILSSQISIYDNDASEGIFQNSNLRSIYIPVGSLSYLPDLTFVNSKIETVTYEGTVEEWNAIGTGSDVFYGSTITEIICSDGVVPIDNKH